MNDKFKDWGKIFEKITHLLKDVCIYKEPLRPNNKKTINLKGKKKMGKNSNMHFTKEDLWIASNHVKTCSTSLVIDMTPLVAQPCPILCDPMDCSPPGSSVHGILQARILEWVAIPSPRDLPNPGIEPRSPALQVDPLPSESPGKPTH